MRLLPLCLLCLVVPGLVAAELVVPSEKVRRRVVVREGPDRSGRDIGSLRPGDRAEHLEELDGWRRVRLEDDTLGFVSAAWTQVVPGSLAPEPPPLAALPTPEPKSAMRRWLDSFSEPPVEFVINDPDPDLSVYRNLDPNLPVSGLARLQGAGRVYDLVLAIDTSGSTHEHAHTDANADGRTDAVWQGRDSIFRAEIEAARTLIDTLARMPRNQGGERIRVGIVSYAGEDRFRRLPVEKDAEITPAVILALAERDAQLWLPLTGDYPAARRALDQLSEREPNGMTDAAAGIGRAIIELTAMAEKGAQSTPRADAQKVILFLTDGKPSLPYDKDQADRAASLAGKLAAKKGIRINAFALGHNAVTREDNDAIKRMARRTGGAHVALESPADIVSVLRSTPFSLVEQVQLVNVTTGSETDYIATGIDGSFYGEIPLVEGTNTIEITAHLDDDRQATETLQIEYVNSRPTEELVKQLKQLKLENEELILAIKDRLAREMARKRMQQERALEMQVEENPGSWPASAE